MITIPIIILTKNAQMPKKAYSTDAGFDLFVSKDVMILPTDTKDVHTDVSVNIPRGYYGRIIGRSSTMRKHGLMVHEGIIDTGFTGELFVSVTNLSGRISHIFKGTRLAQLLVGKTLEAEFEEVLEHTPTERGEQGFGSTGI